MATAYEAWRETKEHLKQEPDSTFLQRVEESLRPAALLDFLASFRGLNTYEEPLNCDPDEAEEFLVKLDELRAPTAAQWNAQIEGMRVLVRRTLQDMRRLNWTGEHTYGDALDDAQQVLVHVLAGNNSWPALERFRCPSIFQNSVSGPYRCVKQLPHESEHSANTAYGTKTWTDEQSVNPPKDNDAPAEICGQRFCSGEYEETCTLSEGHDLPHIGTKITWTSANSWNPIITDQQLDKIADEVFGNPDPINRPQSSRCTSSIEYSAADKGLTLYCKFNAGHDGAHQAPTGEAWTDHMAEISANYPPKTEKAEDTDGECGATNSAASALKEPTCVRPKLHKGPHRDAAGMRWAR